jgi:quercetin dioxygenase-like cupin family protein
MLIQILKPDFVHSDERGVLTQLVREGYSQVNVVQSKAGVFRGGHLHKENNEVFFVVSGEFELTAIADGINEKQTFVAGDMFLVPPNIVHGFKFKTDTILVGLYDKGVENDDGTKDIYTAE